MAREDFPFTSAEERRLAREQRGQQEREELVRAATAAGAEVDGNPVFLVENDTELREVIFWVVYDRSGLPIRRGEGTQKERAYGYNLGGQLLRQGSYEYDQGGNLTTKRTYDASGSLTHEAEFDQQGRLIRSFESPACGAGWSQPAITSTYRPDGRRASETVDRGYITDHYEYVYTAEGTLRGTRLVRSDGQQWWWDADVTGTDAFSDGPTLIGYWHDHYEPPAGTEAPSLDWLAPLSGNPNLPFGYNPSGAVTQDAEPVYGFGQDPDAGTVWNSGYTAQGDPIYDTGGYTGQGDPIAPFNPWNL